MRDLSASLSFSVQVCLEEAVANIMMYSAAKDAPLKIIVEVERRDQTLVARIEDNGSAFDPTQVPRPPVPTSLTQAKVGNLGIHLMRSFASGMHYERREGRNRNPAVCGIALTSGPASAGYLAVPCLARALSRRFRIIQICPKDLPVLPRQAQLSRWSASASS